MSTVEARRRLSPSADGLVSGSSFGSSMNTLRERQPLHTQPHRTQSASNGAGIDYNKNHHALSISFQYDAHVAALLLPCLYLLFAFSGEVVLTVVAIGLIVVYCFDTLDLPEFAFGSFWFTILGSMIALWISALRHMKLSIFSFALISNLCLIILLAGLWGSLHFPWLHKEMPETIRLFEQSLFSMIVVPSAALLCWGAMTLTSVPASPYFLALFLYIGFRFAIMPTRSSYNSKGEVTSQVKGANVSASVSSSSEIPEYIVGSVATVAHTWMLLFLPSVLYIAIHYRVVFTLLGASNVVLLFSISLLLFLTLIDPQKRLDGALWWADVSDRTLHEYQPLLVRVGLVLFALSFQYRVIVYSYSHVLKYYGAYPVVAHLLVAICLISGLVALHLLSEGEHRQKAAEDVRRRSLKICMHISATAFAVSVGVPELMLVFVFLGVETICNFLFNRQFSHYLLFLIAATVAILWFIKRTYWFLEVNIGPFSISGFSSYLAVLFVVALLVPGLTIVDISSLANSMLLIMYVVGVLFGEMLLMRENRHYESDVYPTYLVMATSVTGFFLSLRLYNDEKILGWAHWLFTSICVGKLSLLLSLQKENVFMSIAVAMAVLPMFLLYNGTTRVMNKRWAVIHASTIIASLFWARNRLLKDLIESILVYQLGGASTSPSIRFAVFLVIASVAVSPIAFKHLKLPVVKRLNALLFAVGLLFALIQPDMAILGGSKSVGDVLSGDAPKWTGWLLFFALSLVVMSFTSLLPVPKLVFAVCLSTSLGLYVCGLYIPANVFIYAAFVAMFNCVAIVILYLQFPSPKSRLIVSISFALFIALLPVTYFLERVVFGYAPRRRGMDMLITSRIALLGVHGTLNFIIALFAKLYLSQAARSQDSKSAYMSKSYNRHSNHDASDTPVEVHIGNIATPLCFVLGACLDILYFDGSESTIFLLAPVLLLLNQDDGIFAGLTEDRRYFPLLATSCGFLLLSSYNSIFTNVILNKLGMGPYKTMDLFHAGKNFVMLLIATPSQNSLWRFMWSSARVNDIQAMCIGYAAVFFCSCWSSIVFL